MGNIITKKVKSLVTKVVHKIAKPTYRSYLHLDEDKLYTENEYSLSFLQKQFNKLTIFHSYWYGIIDRKQLFSIKSVLATQSNCEVWLWIDEQTWALNSELIAKLGHVERLKILKYDGISERMGTVFENLSSNHFTQSDNLAFRADAFRILILFKYGGVYFDLDVMFLRDMTSILDREFIYCWEMQPYGNNAIVHLHQPETLQQIYHIVKNSDSFQPWVIFDYSNGLKNVWVLPSAYFDPLWLFNSSNKSGIDNVKNGYSYPIINWDEFFNKKLDKEISFKDFFSGCYAFHWHNRWKLDVVDGSCFDLFDKQFSACLNWKEV